MSLLALKQYIFTTNEKYQQTCMKRYKMHPIIIRKHPCNRDVTSRCIMPLTLRSAACPLQCTASTDRGPLHTPKDIKTKNNTHRQSTVAHPKEIQRKPKVSGHIP